MHALATKITARIGLRREPVAFRAEARDSALGRGPPRGRSPADPRNGGRSAAVPAAGSSTATDAGDGTVARGAGDSPTRNCALHDGHCTSGPSASPDVVSVRRQPGQTIVSIMNHLKGEDEAMRWACDRLI